MRNGLLFTSASFHQQSLKPTGIARATLSIASTIVKS